jgi:hypothetical protein
MQQHAEISELEPFEALVGTWTTEATHVALPGAVVPRTKHVRVA